MAKEGWTGSVSGKREVAAIGQAVRRNVPVLHGNPQAQEALELRAAVSSQNPRALRFGRHGAQHAQVVAVKEARVQALRALDDQKAGVRRNHDLSLIHI